MARTVRASRPFKLDATRNTRDLGGYPTKYGINTATGQFLRSDNPSKLTEDDLKRLYDYGVRLQVDLRSAKETERAPSKLMGYKDIEFLNPQLHDNVHSADGGVVTVFLVGDRYVSFLDHSQTLFLPVFKNIIENHMDDCVFFNCSAGKDRTGTLAMILLKLAGCSDEVIVKDYEVTGENIKPDMDPILEDFRRRNVPMDEDVLRSRPVHMERALDHLKTKYGTIEDWLLLVGLTMPEICKLSDKILGQY